MDYKCISFKLSPNFNIIYIFNYFGYFTEWKNSQISLSLLWNSWIGYFTSFTKMEYLFGYFTRFVRSRISHQCQFAFLPHTPKLTSKSTYFLVEFRIVLSRIRNSSELMQLYSNIYKRRRMTMNHTQKIKIACDCVCVSDCTVYFNELGKLSLPLVVWF